MVHGFKPSKLPPSDAFFIKDPMQRFYCLPNSTTRCGPRAHSDQHSGSHLINVAMAFLSVSNVFVSGKHLWIDSLYTLFCFSGILDGLCCMHIETPLLFSVITTFSYVSSSLTVYFWFCFFLFFWVLSSHFWVCVVWKKVYLTNW